MIKKIIPLLQGGKVSHIFELAVILRTTRKLTK